MDTWMSTLNGEMNARAEWRRINGFFGGKGKALMIFLAGVVVPSAGKAVMISGTEPSYDLGH